MYAAPSIEVSAAPPTRVVEGIDRRGGIVSRGTQDDEGVPAGFGARVILTATPFAAAALVWWVLRWLGG